MSINPSPRTRVCYRPAQQSRFFKHILVKLFASITLLAVLCGSASAQLEIRYPAQGSPLTGSTQTFYVESPGDVTDWWIYAGSSAGAKDYVDSGNLGGDVDPGEPAWVPGLLTEVSGFPQDSSIVHIRIWYRQAGAAWAFDDFTYTAQQPSTPKLTSPVPSGNSQLTGRDVMFEWDDNGYGASEYLIGLGHVPGNEFAIAELFSLPRPLYKDGNIKSTYTIVGGLPAMSRNSPQTWYVALLAKRPGEQSYTRVDDAIVQQYNPNAVPSIISPAPDTVLTSSSDNFEWQSHGVDVTNYWVYVGARLGGREYFDSGNLNTYQQVTINTLPTDASEVYVRLWYRTSNGWKYSDQQYKASGIGPEITDPVPGTDPDGTQLFNWTANGVDVAQYWLQIGHRPGARGGYDSGNLGTATFDDSVDYFFWPDGDNYNARLWFRSSTSDFWKHSDFTYQTTD